MRPPFLRGGEVSQTIYIQRGETKKLQWGRPFYGAESLLGSIFFLQWRKRFNGAALFTGRRELTAYC